MSLAAWAHNAPFGAATIVMGTAYHNVPNGGSMCGPSRGVPTLRDRWRSLPLGSCKVVRGNRRRRLYRGVMRAACGGLLGRDAERLGMGPAVVPGQDLTEAAGPVRHGAVADLATGDRQLGNGHREAAGR